MSTLHVLPDPPDLTAASASPSLPQPRGVLGAAMLGAIEQRQDRPVPARMQAAVAEAEPFGEDLQLALYCAYELHYRGFAGVPAQQEWDPTVLGLRALLEARFLQALRGAVDGGEGVAAALDGLLSATGQRGVSAYLAREGRLWQLREVAVHRSLYHLKEADPQAWVLPRLHGAVKAAVAAVEFDEYGAGQATRMHSELFAASMRELDLDATYGAWLDHVPAPMLALVNFMSLCGLHRGLRAAALGQLTAVEISSPPGSARMSAAARRLGLPVVEAFYAEHEVADSVHEQVMRVQVLGPLLAVEPELAADVVLGIQGACLLEDRLDATTLTAWAQSHSSLLRPIQ
jgi:hypothetical protein